MAPTTGGFTTSDLWTKFDIHKQKVSLRHLKEHLPEISEDILGQYPDNYLLFFWAQATRFRVVRCDTSEQGASFREYAERTRPKIQSESGENIGTIYGFDNGPKSQGNNLQEFISVGRRHIRDMPEEMCPPVILALQIERGRYNICSRANFAEIKLSAWKDAKPNTVLIALQ